MRPDTVQFSDYPVRNNDNGRTRRWMRLGGGVLRFWLPVLALVIGLQATGNATNPQASDTTAEADKSQLVLPIKEDAASNPAGADPADKKPAAAVNEVTKERVRDHSARELKEMGLWFLEAAAILAVLVFVYKLLVYWIRARRGNS